MPLTRSTTVAIIAAILGAGGAFSGVPAAAAGQGPAAAQSAAAVVATPVSGLPFTGSGDVTGAGTGSPGTAASNTRVAAACNAGVAVSAPQWFRLPPVASQKVYARVDAPYISGRNWAYNPSGSAFVDLRTGAVVSCGEGPVTLSTRRPLALVAYFASPVAECAPEDYCDWREGALRVFVNTTTGVAPRNDHWQQASSIPSLPFTATVDTSFADGDEVRLFDYERCLVSAIDPRQLGTAWWRYTPRATGPLSVSVDLRTQWDADLGRPPGAVVALLTEDGPVPVPRSDPDNCDSPPLFQAGKTYLIGVAVYDDAYYDNTLVRGGPVTVRVGNVRTPRIPTGVSQTVSRATRSVLVNWQPPQADSGTPVTGYRVVLDRRMESGAWKQVSRTDLPSTARSWTGRRLSAAQTYRVRVSAMNRSGAGPAAELVTWTGS
jgi:hypothetical protein